MLGWVAAVSATESPSQLSPALIQRMWMTPSSGGLSVTVTASPRVGNRARVRQSASYSADSEHVKECLFHLSVAIGAANTPVRARRRAAPQPLTACGRAGTKGDIGRDGEPDGVERAEAARLAGQFSRFQLAPPRRFLLPAVLLLLAEAPAHGYSLLKGLGQLNFGRVDRPSVYRALAQLERDGLVESRTEGAAGKLRHVYELTGQGRQILRTWMVIIRDERDCLDRVLHRYQATGSADALIAEAGGDLGTLHSTLSAVSSTAVPIRFLPASRNERLPTADPIGLDGPITSDDPIDSVIPVDSGVSIDGADTATGPAARSCFRVVPERSVVLIDVRSSVGPISFGVVGVSGWVEAQVHDGVVSAARAPRRICRSPSRGSARATASTTPSSCAASTPAAIRRRRSTCGPACRSRPPAATGWPVI